MCKCMYICLRAHTHPLSLSFTHSRARARALSLSLSLSQTYFDDVEMQMEAKMYAEMYNAENPPKKVDFLDAYVLELRGRPAKPICAVEKYIEGEYKKFNNNRCSTIKKL